MFGHLSLYPARVLEHLGQPTGVTRVPEGWEARFKSGAECLDDPDGKEYPDMPTLTGFYFAAYKAAAEAIRGASDEALAAPNPAAGRMKELFPQLGAMLMFYLCGHPQVHLGQLSAWRRMMGLAPV
ncbi:MAG: DinB family protein [Phycisphaerae bacterium]